MKKRNKIILLIVGVLVVILSVFLGTRFYKESQPMLTLKKKEFIIEYGELVTRNIKEYININDYKAKKKGPPLLETQMKLDIPDDVLFPSVGEYKGTITYKEEKLEFKVIVKDTTSPEIVSYFSNENIETYAGIVPKYQEMFDAKDLSSFILSYDDSKVDYEKAGTYTLTVKAIDNYDNETVKKIDVIVKEKELDLGLDTLTFPETSYTKFQTKIKGKPENVSYFSSNDKIASVDEQGVVYAKSPGEAIITAKMGEITDTCKVVVKYNPYYKQGK